MRILFVGAGGFFGAIFRYLLGGWVHKILNNPWYPYGTFVVNILGCLFIGVLGGLAENKHLFSPNIRLFLLVGLLGGFTTFSTFGYDTFVLFRDTQILAAIMNIASQVVLGVGAAYLGYMLSSLI